MDYLVLEARYVRDYVVWLRFRDGTEGEIDLEPSLRGPVFEPLKDIEYFRQFSVHPEFETLTWPNGADIAPEFLHDNARRAHAESAERFHLERNSSGASSAASLLFASPGSEPVPEVSRFYGIVIAMYYEDHGSPHFHAAYGGGEASVDIESGRFRGRLPTRAEWLVRDWLNLHRAELLQNWQRCRRQEPLVRIAPLE
jgi:hypothetical protein